jgi:Tfp pilus assembly protein FimV
MAAVSWLAVRPDPMRTARVTAPVRGDLRTTLGAAEALELLDLSDIEVDAVDLWATDELALLQDDFLDAIRSSADLGLDDRLAELTAEELENLSRELDSQNEGG